MKFGVKNDGENLCRMPRHAWKAKGTKMEGKIGNEVDYSKKEEKK